MNLLDSKNNLEIRDYFRILLRRKWYFLIPFAAVIAVGIYKVRSQIPIYESRCTIQIKPSTLKLLPSSIKEALPRVSEPATAFAVKRQILSTEYLTQVIDRLNLKEHPRILKLTEETKETFPDKDIDEIREIMAIRLLKGYIRVENRTPIIVVLRALSPDPELAYMIVKTLSEIYIDDSYRRAMSAVQGAMNFNDGQISVFKKRLEEAEEELEAFRRNQITTNLLDENLDTQELGRIHKALVSIEITTKEKKDYLDYLDSQLSQYSGIESLPESNVVKETMSKIDTRIEEMAALMKRFSWKSPEVINVNRKINDLREIIKNDLESLLRQRYSSADAPTIGLMLEKVISQVDIDILERKRMALDNMINSFKEVRSQKPAEEMQLAKLQAEVQVNRRIYNMFLQQNEGVQIEEMISRNDASDRFKVLDVPRRPSEPINAGTNMMMLITMVVAIGLSSGAVYSREYLDSSIRTVNEAEDYFKLPVLGVLPELGLAVPEEKGGRKRIVLLSAVGAAVVLLLILFLKYVVQVF